MANRVAVIAIIAESTQASGEINSLLHEFNSFIIGRMGLPYRERKLNIITIAVDAPQDTINALSGKLGRIPGVTAKAVCSREQEQL
jgi:putative iron-only hydrogenase system regulator